MPVSSGIANGPGLCWEDVSGGDRGSLGSGNNLGVTLGDELRASKEELDEGEGGDAPEMRDSSGGLAELGD